jgi:hypothetical protein
VAVAPRIVLLLSSSSSEEADMARFVVSTCGVLAEAAALESLASTWMLIVVGATLGAAVLTWWSAARPVVDRIVGVAE